jgi:hypothetical protein
MCWMTVRRGRDALKEGVRDTVPHEGDNGHSWGWAYADGGDLVVERGLGRIPLRDVPVVEAALVHTRYATVGEVSPANAHPFPVERGGEAVAALAHNGTWYDAPDIEGWSDSRAMAAVLSRALDADPTLGFREAFARLGDVTGETLAALHRDGTCYVHAGRFGITRGGAVFASSGHDPLPDGVHVVEPGEEVPA